MNFKIKFIENYTVNEVGQMKKIFLLTSILIIYSTEYVFSQENNELNLVKKYLWLKKEVNTREVLNLYDINNLLNYIGDILNEDPWIIEYGAEIKFYFNDLDINFYKFVAMTSTMYPYIKIIGVDNQKNIFEIEDEIEFINNLPYGLNLPDTIKITHYSNIYNKIVFLDEDIEFIEKYDPSIFGPPITFQLFNKVDAISDTRTILMKMYWHRTKAFIDRYQISYVIEDGKFNVIKLLVSRN